MIGNQFAPKDQTPAACWSYFLTGNSTGKRRKGMRNPPRRKRFNYAGDAAGLIEGERTGAKKTRQRDRTRRNWDALGKRRIGCRRTAGDYRNVGADAGSGWRLTGTTGLRCKSLGIYFPEIPVDFMAPRPHQRKIPLQTRKRRPFRVVIGAAGGEMARGWSGLPRTCLSIQS